MDMTGEERISASRETVWAALNNPEILKQCIPRCEKLEMISPTVFAATFNVKIGPVSTSFKSELTLSNVNPPEGYTLSGEGHGGLAGSAKVSADIALKEEAEKTVLNYTFHLQTSGLLAKAASHLIESGSTKLVGNFFRKFNKMVSKTSAA
jgi:hypothetical protein